LVRYGPRKKEKDRKKKKKNGKPDARRKRKREGERTLSFPHKGEKDPKIFEKERWISGGRRRRKRKTLRCFEGKKKMSRKERKKGGKTLEKNFYYRGERVSIK